jgi:uncharacterized protein (DUF697 family)
MNQPVLLHIVEKLEGLLGKLPATIQKPILSELTPLKELFLQQRSPRLVLLGSSKPTVPELLTMLFRLSGPGQTPDTPMSVYRWQNVNAGGHGTVSILDARGMTGPANREVEEEIRRQPADVILFVDDGEQTRGPRKVEIENLIACVDWNDVSQVKTKIIGVVFSSTAASVTKLKEVLASKPTIRDRILKVFSFSSAEASSLNARELMSTLTRELPNEARVEMIRISRDREAQREVAQVLVKSTTAICTAIGAQPIPFADLPILTTLQLVMVSGIMYLSGRERSLRASTEFVGALGANVGVGMLLREGARALLKFVPGWGNLICGVVAGAGTYAIGRAAIAFFLEGVSLKDARRTYLASRKKRPGAVLPALQQARAGRLPANKRKAPGSWNGP